MFIRSKRRRYTRDGEQRGTGDYLVLACGERGEKYRELRGFVRSVELRQLGHWMMGSVNIDGTRIGLSGPLGSDGLPLDKDACPNWDRMVVVPEDVATIFWTDSTGHNDVGVSGKDLLTWALANEKALVKAGRSLRKEK